MFTINALLNDTSNKMWPQAAFGLALAAVIMCIVILARNPPSTTTNTIINVPVAAIGAAAIEAVIPLTEWGGIDYAIPNPAHITDSLHNMDNMVDIYPAAILHGSLALQQG